MIKPELVSRELTSYCVIFVFTVTNDCESKSDIHSLLSRINVFK